MNTARPDSRYYGKVCAKHPDLNGLRRKANRSCPACLNEKRIEAAKRNPEDAEKKRERQKKYQRENRAMQAERMRKWRAENPDRDEANRAKWIAENYERKAETNKRFREANRDKVNLYAATYRALKLRAHAKWANNFFIEEAYRLAKMREKLCGGTWHVDHIVPLNSVLVCGLHVESNLQVIPGKTNLSKQNRYWPDMPVDS